MITQKITKIWLSLALMGISLATHADEAQMNDKLVRLINQIDIMMPIIDEAENAQDTNARVQFHFDGWTDTQQIHHNGLRDDLLNIRQSLIDEINKPELTPKTIAPMSNDYLDR